MELCDQKGIILRRKNTINSCLHWENQDDSRRRTFLLTVTWLTSFYIFPFIFSFTTSLIFFLSFFHQIQTTPQRPPISIVGLYGSDILIYCQFEGFSTHSEISLMALCSSINSCYLWILYKDLLSKPRHPTSTGR